MNDKNRETMARNDLMPLLYTKTILYTRIKIRINYSIWLLNIFAFKILNRSNRVFRPVM